MVVGADHGQRAVGGEGLAAWSLPPQVPGVVRRRVPVVIAGLLLGWRRRAVRPARRSGAPSASAARPLTNTYRMPGGGQPRLGEGRAVGHRVRIEQHQVGGVARLHQAPVAQPQPAGGAGRSGGRRTPRGRGCPGRGCSGRGSAGRCPTPAGAACRRPAARRCRRCARVAHDRAHVLLVPDVLQDAGAELVARPGCRCRRRTGRGLRRPRSRRWFGRRTSPARRAERR